MIAESGQMLVVNGAKDTFAALGEFVQILGLPVTVVDASSALTSATAEEAINSPLTYLIVVFDDMPVKTSRQVVAVDSILQKVVNTDPVIPIIFVSEFSDIVVNPSARREALLNRLRHEIEHCTIIKCQNDAPLAANLIGECLNRMAIAGITVGGDLRRLFEAKRELSELLKKQEWDLTYTKCKALVKEFPRDNRLALILIKTMWRTGQLDTALQMINTLVKRGVKSLNLFSLGAAIARKLKNQKMTITMLKNAQAISADNVGIMVAMGDLLLEEGHYDAAQRKYTKAKALDPNNDMALAGCLATDILSGSIPLEKLQSSGQSSEDLVRLFNLKAVDLVDVGQFDKAKTLYLNVEKVASGRPDWTKRVMFNQFILEKKRGDKLAALREFERCRALDPTFSRLIEHAPFALKVASSPGSEVSPENLKRWYDTHKKSVNVTPAQTKDENSGMDTPPSGKDENI